MEHSIDTKVLSYYSLKEQDDLSYILASTKKIDPFSGTTYLQLRKKQIENHAKKLIQKFPHHHNQNIFKTIDHIFAIFDETLLLQFREHELLQLIRTIYLFQYSYAFLHSRDGSFVFRLLPTHIFTNLIEKKILSIIVKSKQLKKYDCLEDEHLFSIVQRHIPNIRIIPASSYNLYNQKGSPPILYFQIEKTSYHSFSTSEVLLLKKNFGADLPSAVETRRPYIFSARNEEEIFKNMLILAKEFTTIEDLPQVIISQENSDASGMHFTVIIVRIQKKRQPFFSKSLQAMKVSLKYRIIREQIVRFFENTHPIIASVISISIPVSSQILRRNHAFDFYRSRRIVSQFLTTILGEFRDYNGGMMVKQMELLFALKIHTAHLENKSEALIEDFFYSLNPIENQATTKLEELIFFYSCFLQTITCTGTNSPDFFYLTYTDSDLYCTGASITSNDRDVQPMYFIPEIFCEKIITYHVQLQNTHLFGYLYRDSPIEIQRAIESALEKKYSQKALRTKTRISFSSPILSLDPRLSGDESSISLLQLLFEGLMQYGPNGIVTYGIAKSARADLDNRCYHFELRESFWSNRCLLTAEDFLYTWKKTLHPKFFSPFSHLLYPIKNAKAIKEGHLPSSALGVHVTAPLSFSIYLEYPIRPFLHFLTHPIYFPICASLDESNPNWFSQMGCDYVCNGPFTLESRNENGSYLLKKNSLFWNCSDIVSEQMIISYDQPREAYTSCKKGTIDYYGPLPSSWKNTETKHQITFPMNSMYYYLYNTKCSYFHNDDLRLAFAYAIHRKKILQSISKSGYIRMYEERKILMTPPEYDLSCALAYYRSALHILQVTSIPKLRVIYLDSPMRSHIIQLLCAEWSRVFGIEFHLEPLPWNQLIARMLEGSFDIGGLIWQSSFADLSYMLFSFTEELLLFTNWDMSEYRQTLDLIKLYGESQPVFIQKAIQILEKYVPVIPIFSLNYIGYVKPGKALSLKQYPCNFRYFSN